MPPLPRRAINFVPMKLFHQPWKSQRNQIWMGLWQWRNICRHRACGKLRYTGTYVILKYTTNVVALAPFSKEVIIKDLYLPTIDCKFTICEKHPIDLYYGCRLWAVLLKNCWWWHCAGWRRISDRFITVDWGKACGFCWMEVSGCNFDGCPKPAIYRNSIISDLANITVPKVACRNEVSMYTIQKYGATDYQWTVQGGVITAGQGSNTIFGGMVKWHFRNGGGKTTKLLP